MVSAREKILLCTCGEAWKNSGKKICNRGSVLINAAVSGKNPVT
jgi:hypothetical protein